MPFIDSKISFQVSDEKKEIIKTKLGQSIGIMHKPESFLMVGFQDGYDLFMAGKKLDKGAFVAVSLFGSLTSSDCEKMTEKICDILYEELGIPGESVYVTYQGVSEWGWNGRNF